MRLFLVFVVLLVFSTFASGQEIGTDSSGTTFIPDTSQRILSKIASRSYDEIMREILSSNRNINYTDSAVAAINMTRKSNGKEWLFYILATDIFLLGLFKVFYSKYFNNIFRVFFNTSLRQNQLTDLLLQARLPSLIFNLFFIVNAGLYLWLVFNSYSLHIPLAQSVFLLICIAALGIIYSVKFFAVKIIGWVTGMTEPADTYIFVIFLINKIIGIILIPFIVLLAFAPAQWERGLTFLSFALILLSILLRFYRSYGLLEHQFILNRFHFFIYVMAFEVLPVLILYKTVMKMNFIT